MCRNIRAWQAVLNAAGIAASQPILGPWLRDEGYRHPRAARGAGGRPAQRLGVLPAASGFAQREVIAKLLLQRAAGRLSRRRAGHADALLSALSGRVPPLRSPRSACASGTVLFTEPLETLRGSHPGRTFCPPRPVVALVLVLDAILPETIPVGQFDSARLRSRPGPASR